MILNINLWSISKKLFRLIGGSGGAFYAGVTETMTDLVRTAACHPGHYGFNYIPLEHADECPG